MSTLHAALAELADEWEREADRLSPGSLSTGARYRCAAQLLALLAAHPAPEAGEAEGVRSLLTDLASKAESGVRPSITIEVEDEVRLSEDGDAPLSDYEQLRAAVKNLAYDMHRGWKHVGGGADAAVLLDKLLDGFPPARPAEVAKPAGETRGEWTEVES